MPWWGWTLIVIGAIGIGYLANKLWDKIRKHKPLAHTKESSE